MRINRAYLWLPLGLVPPIASLWNGRYLLAALYSLFLLWTYHPRGLQDWRAKLRAAGIVGRKTIRRDPPSGC